MDNDAIFTALFADRAFNNSWTNASESFAATHGVIVDTIPKISLRRFFSKQQRFLFPAIQTTEAFIFIQNIEDDTCYQLSISSARILYSEMSSYW